MNCVLSIIARKQAVVHFRIRAISSLRKENNLVKTIKNMMTDKPEAESSNDGKALKFGRYPVCNSRLEVIGSGAYGGPRSVYLSANEVPYLFNCGEGVQRLCSEYRIKVNKIQHAFITYPSWKNIVGLFGVMLELQAGGIQDFHIYGHPCIANIFNETNRFVALRRISLHFEDIFDENDICFDNVQITKVFLYSSSSSLKNLNKNASEPELQCMSQQDAAKDQKLLEDYDDEGIDYYSHLSGNRKRCKIITKHKNKKRSKSEACQLIESSIEKFALSYICKLKKILGTLLIEKCVTLGVPPGQLLGQLKSGQDIVLSDGRVIKSSDVKSPDIPGDVVIFVECPSEDYLDSLLNEPKFFKHQTNDTNPELIASVVVHFSSCEIIENPKYKEWMSRFPRQTKHVLINESNQWTGSVGIHRMQLKMNLIHPEVFPLLHESKVVFEQNGNAKIKENSEAEEMLNSNQQEKNSNLNIDEEDAGGIGKLFYKWDENSVIKGDAMCSVFLKPKKDYDYSKLFVIKDCFLEEVFQNEGFSEELEKLKLILKEMEPVTNGNEYPKIQFLGTGSSKPSKARNTSGILIFLDENNSILFDCGEATYGQLVRFYGKDKAREILRNLKAVFISHLHPDHHLGLISVLLERNLLMDMDKFNTNKPGANDKNKLTSSPQKLKSDHRPLCILAPGQMIRWLKVVDRDLEAIANTYELIPNDKLENSKKDPKFSEKLLELMNLDTTTAFVRHVANSFGISIKHKDGWKLTYSGDTMPSENLIEIGRDSDVLIHEATMDDCLKEEAARKFHSTNTQAIEVGKKMNAKFTLLTHFSQRYHYSPFFNEYFNENVGVAYDNMLVSINQLKILPKLTNVLKLVFLNHYEKLEEIKTKRQRSTERKIEKQRVKGSIG